MAKEEMELLEKECCTEENDSKIWEYWDDIIDATHSYQKNGVYPYIKYGEFKKSALHFIAIGRLMERNLL